MPGIEARFLDRAVYGPVAILYELSGNAKRAFFFKKKKDPISKAAAEL